MQNRIVSKDEWLVARKELLAKEKTFTRARDALSAERRALPWVRVDEDYVFDTADGRRTLAELFDGRSQLVVYHFMFAPEWEAGCKSCSFWADNFDRSVVHLAHRGITLIAVSRAPLATLQAYAKRMGWSFPWVSSGGSRFNHDFGVSFTSEQIASGTIDYNYQRTEAHVGELPGVSVFYRDAGGAVLHTYSTYARGLDMFNTAYHYMDIVPLGRDEGDGIMAWLRRRDEYDAP